MELCQIVLPITYSYLVNIYQLWYSFKAEGIQTLKTLLKL